MYSLTINNGKGDTMTTTNQTQTVPELESFCGSWVVVSRETGEPVFETYSQETAEKINQEKYEVLTSYQWLIRFNKSVAGQAEKKVQSSKQNVKSGDGSKKPVVILD